MQMNNYSKFLKVFWENLLLATRPRSVEVFQHLGLCNEKRRNSQSHRVHET